MPNKYRITKKGEQALAGTEPKKKASQATIILRAVQRAARDGASAADVRKAARLRSESEHPERLIGYYLTTLKKEGLITGTK